MQHAHRFPLHRLFSPRLLTALLISFLLITSCTPAPSQAVGESHQPTGTATNPVERTPEPAANATDDPEPIPTATFELDQPREQTVYDLEVLFDFYGRRLEVRQRIDYSSPSSSEIDELVLMVESNRYAGTFNLESMSVEGIPVKDFSLEKNVLRVPLAEALHPGERMVIELNFSLAIPPIQEPSSDHRPELFGYTERQVNLVDWYPMVAYYQPEQGWLAHPAWYYGEHQVYESAEYLVNLRMAEPVEGLTIAASSIPDVQDGVYTYRMEAARNFVFSASTQYQVATAQVGDIVVNSYSFPFDALAGQQALQYTVEAIQIYSRLFGPYPQKSLSVVEADFLDGMEFEGLFFLSKGFFNIYDGKPGSYLGAITVHETAHMWWYSQVGNDQALEPWLDEALCTYSEYLYYEEYYPDAIEWWRQVRVEYYEPKGTIDLPIDGYSGYIPYRNAVYLRGAMFLHELRQKIGDEAFFSALRSLVAQHRYDRLMTADDFFAAVRAQSVENIDDLLAEYFSNR